MAKGFGEGDLHLLGLCEVGGHKKGLRDLHIHPPGLIDGVLAEGEYDAEAMQAYMSVWDQAGAAQPGGVSLQLWKGRTCVPLSSAALEPQLVIFEFHVTAEGHEGKMGRLLQGLLHIRTPAGKKHLLRLQKKANGRSTERAGEEG